MAWTIFRVRTRREIALIARRLCRPAPVNARLTALARRAVRDGLRPGSIDVERLLADVRPASIT